MWLETCIGIWTSCARGSHACAGSQTMSRGIIDMHARESLKLRMAFSLSDMHAGGSRSFPYPQFLFDALCELRPAGSVQF